MTNPDNNQYKSGKEPIRNHRPIQLQSKSINTESESDDQSPTKKRQAMTERLKEKFNNQGKNDFRFHAKKSFVFTNFQRLLTKSKSFIIFVNYSVLEMPSPNQFQSKSGKEPVRAHQTVQLIQENVIQDSAITSNTGKLLLTAPSGVGLYSYFNIHTFELALIKNTAINPTSFYTRSSL